MWSYDVDKYDQIKNVWSFKFSIYHKNQFFAIFDSNLWKERETITKNSNNYDVIAFDKSKNYKKKSTYFV